jgi:hypothetical protein
MSDAPQNSPEGGGPTPKSAIHQHYERLHAQCGAILATAITGTNEAKVARSHQFVQEIELWTTILQTRRETALLRVAAYEFQFALLALNQGHYRHAFKALRLVLELALQSTHLSTRELELREWLQNRKDTVWAAVIDHESGVFSKRFARCFFPTLEAHLPSHGALAEQVYRECSECVHGNVPKHIPLPDSLAFSQSAFDLWHAKADVVALLFHFVLVMRYMEELTPSHIQKLEAALLARVGHVQEIRVALGGPMGG